MITKLDLIYFIYIFLNTDKRFTKELFGIKSRLIVSYRIVFKNKIYLNPRSCINSKYLSKNRNNFTPTRYELKSYFIHLNKFIHPFIDYCYVKENFHISEWRYASEIEKILMNTGKFQDKRFIHTDIALNYETHPLTALEALHLAGNAYLNDGRLLFPISEK